MKGSELELESDELERLNAIGWSSVAEWSRVIEQSRSIFKLEKYMLCKLLKVHGRVQYYVS